MISKVIVFKEQLFLLDVSVGEPFLAAQLVLHPLAAACSRCPSHGSSPSLITTFITSPLTVQKAAAPLSSAAAIRAQGGTPANGAKLGRKESLLISSL